MLCDSSHQSLTSFKQDVMKKQKHESDIVQKGGDMCNETRKRGAGLPGKKYQDGRRYSGVLNDPRVCDLFF